jgi:iron complex outermembrane receptor protein
MPLTAQSSEATTLKKLSIEELMDVEVTSVSKRPEKLSDTASAIQVITQEDIRRAGVTSLPEALRLASNLQVAQKNAHDWGISARGFNTELANKLLVLIDGRTAYTPLLSGVFWDVQDYLLEDIDHIEVISGPGGSVWGANAVNGVINITTKNARDTQGLYIEGGGGTALQGFGGMRYGGTLGEHADFRVYGKYFDRDNSTLADGRDVADSWHMSQGGFRMDAEPSAQHLLTLQSDFYDGDEHIATGNVSEVSGVNVLGRWSHAYAEGASLSLQLYYDRTHLVLPKPSNGFVPAGRLKNDLDTYDVDFTHHFLLNTQHHFVWGLGYRLTRDVVDNAPSLVFLPARLNQALFNGFLEDKITLREDLFLTLGTKLEHNDYTGFEFEPSGRLQWSFTPQQMLWSAVSRAVRTPSRIDHDLTEPTGLPAPFPQSILNGGSDFKSETVIAYELGYRAQLTPAVATSISTFYNDYEHIRSTTPGVAGFPSFGFPLLFENNLQGETYGLELSTTYQALDWWRLKGGYNLLKENLHVTAGHVDFSNALNETADPEHQASLRSSMDLYSNVQLDVGLRWVNTLHNNNGPIAGTVPSYFEADVRLGWQLHNGVELSVTGQNLLHNHHPEYGFPSDTREEIARSVVAKAVWRY